jgi:hypothetical protein
MGVAECVYFDSHPVYVVGVGLKLTVRLNKADSNGLRRVGAHVLACSYQLPATQHTVQCKLVRLQSVVFQLQTLQGWSEVARRGLCGLPLGHFTGKNTYFLISQASDLKPHLVDGSLRCRARVEAVL